VNRFILLEVVMRNSLGKILRISEVGKFFHVFMFSTVLLMNTK